jgi:serine/threonine protein kinase
MHLGAYEILALAGAGGMGEVYRARDTRLDRTVAIKVLAASLTADPQLRERFDREARAISSLNHPHICTLHDVGHLQFRSGAPSFDGSQIYAVTKDGKRFLVNARPAEISGLPLTVVVNWPATIQK